MIHTFTVQQQQARQRRAALLLRHSDLWTCWPRAAAGGDRLDTGPVSAQVPPCDSPCGRQPVTRPRWRTWRCPSSSQRRLHTFCCFGLDVLSQLVILIISCIRSCIPLKTSSCLLILVVVQRRTLHQHSGQCGGLSPLRSSCISPLKATRRAYRWASEVRPPAPRAGGQGDRASSPRCRHRHTR